jgi:putative peptidoglycan lipid II flippase
VAQIDYIVDTSLASLVSATAAATNIIVFNYAFALQALPAGVFGYALGVAALPTLAKEFAQENLSNFKSTLTSSLHQIMYLVIPTVVMMVVLRVPIVRLVYGAPSFDWQATKLTAFTLAAFAAGILGQAAIQLLGRGFYALHDTKTPVKISVATIALNVFLSVTLIYFFNNIIFLGIASTVAGLFNAFMLLIFLSKRVGGLDWRQVLMPIGKMAIAGALAGVALYTPLKVLDSAAYGQLWLQGSIIHTFIGPLALDTSHTFGLLIVTVISAIIGMAVYFLVTYVLGIEEIALFTRLFRRFGRKRVRDLDEVAASEPVTGNSQEPTQ